MDKAKINATTMSNMSKGKLLALKHWDVFVKS